MAEDTAYIRVVAGSIPARPICFKKNQEFSEENLKYLQYILGTSKYNLSIYSGGLCSNYYVVLICLCACKFY